MFGISLKIADFFDNDEEIKDPKNLDPSQIHIMIFDDVMNADQTVIKDYFCRGRHNNVNVFYLCQSLPKIQKHCIRENANVFILFHQDDKTLKYFDKYKWKYLIINYQIQLFQNHFMDQCFQKIYFV